MKNIIDYDGYCIYNITDDVLKKIKIDLTILKENYFKNKIIDTIQLYEYKDNKIIIPIYYGIKNFKNCNNLMKLNTVDFKFKGDLFDYQKEIVDICLKKIKKKGGGILCVPCGYGKTICSIYISSMLKLRTLVVVNKIFLKDQWCESIKKFTTATYSDDIDSSADIIILMIQSISKEKYNKKSFEKFSFVIYDEAHHVPSKTYIKSLKYTISNYNLALTATPHRDDNLEKIMHFYLGDIIYNIERCKNNNVDVHIKYFNTDDKLFKVIYNNNNIDYVNTISNLCKIKKRNDFIIDIINNLIDENRNILILSNRIFHLKLLQENIKKKSYIYTSNLKKDDRDFIEKNANIILSTYQLASEGLDIKRLNTIIFGTPQKKIKQSVGRILRTFDFNIKPIVIDIVDNIFIFKNQYKKRLKEYTLSEYNIINKL